MRGRYSHIKRATYTKRYIILRVVLIFLIITAFFFIRATFNSLDKKQRASERLDQVEREYEDLQERHDQLSASIERLSTESGIEEEIRDTYGLVKEGEEVIILVDDIEDEDMNADEEGGGIWRKIKLFFGF